ncbi:MAG TPA: acyloxyacyl hydrolase [Azonexus sp.]
MRKTTIGILGGALLALAGQAAAETQYFLQAGHSLQPSDGQELGLVEVGATVPLPWRWHEGRLTSKLEFAAGYSDTRNGGSFQGLVMPLVRYQAAATGLFFEAGLGAVYVSNTRWRDDHDLGSHWLFTERLGIGYDFGHYDLGLYLGHMSNGGLNKDNDGAESVGIRFAYTF